MPGHPVTFGQDDPLDDGEVPTALRITRSQPRRGITLFTLLGDVDPVTGLQLRKDLLAALQSAEPTIVVDLTGVEFLGTIGLQALQEALAWAQPWHRLRLVTATARVGRLLELSGLAADAETFDSLDEALEAPSRSGLRRSGQGSAAARRSEPRHSESRERPGDLGTST